MSDLALSVVLGASMRSGFDRMFGSASKSVGVLGAAVKQTHAQLNEVRAYQRNDAALDAMRTKLGETQTKVMALRKALAADPNSAKLAKQLETTHNKAVKLGAALDAQRTKLRQEGEALQRAGIDTKDLNSANERLTRTWEKQKTVLGAQYAQLEKRKRLRGELMGQVAKLGTVFLAGRALAGWTNDAANFDAEMQNIGNTADMTRPQIDALKQSIFDASQQTGRGIGDVQAGIGFLVAAGLDVGRAQKSIVAIGRTATAEAANIEDLSRASFTLIDSMGIKPTGLAEALDILTQAGKDGNVELRDMAQQLPGLGAMFNAMHMQGTSAVASMGAALEIARKGAADPAEAANNMRNYIKALFSPTTLQKAKKFGLDITKVMADAQKSGGNPFEASIQAIMKATGGDATKLGQLFQDAQAQAFLRPMMQNWKDYERIKHDALSAHGVVDRDFAKVEHETKQGLARMGQSWDRLKKNVGSGLGGVFVNAFGWVTPVLNGIGKLAGTFPRLTAGLIAATGAAFTWRAAMVGGQWIASMIPGVGTLGELIRKLVPGFGLAEKAVMRLGAAWEVFNLEFLLSPVGLIIAGIGVALVGAALLVHKYWQPIAAFFTGVWQGVKAAMAPVLQDMGNALAPLKPAWDAIASAIGAVVGWFEDLLQPVHSTQAQLAQATSVGQTFGRVLGFVFKSLTFNIRMVIKAVAWLGNAIGTAAGWTVVHMGKAADAVSGAWNGAISFIGGLWDALKAKVAAVVNWVTAKIEWVANKWKTIKGLPGAVWGDIKQAGASIGNTFSGPAMAAAGGPAFKMPAMASRGNVTQNYQGGPTTLTINAAPGMDERALAKHVREQLDERDRQQAARRRSALSDLD